MVYCRNVKRTGERNPNMSQTIDTPSYTIELSDGSIRPMTVKELAIRLEQLMSADKGIAEMPVGLSVDSEGNGVYVPRVFVPKEAGGDNPMDNVVGVIAEEDCAYRYAFDHPNERILWMSPSTYIEQEQEASIRRELPNQEFKNIERMTYQTAMHRAQKGNLDIHADTVIFDEFHHTGAPQWSRGVEGVIECNPDANLIGLSATSIRYSDSGRDMSDELFDGHIASYMSLTDCWVLGILPVPTYVTAGYSINGYIEDLGERIAKEESAGRRAELLADFNELRDCASRAANLPAIFQKYFEGIEKVIVFCPNVFELNEIEKMCPRWFSRVNGNVHTYVVHSSNPFGTSEYDGFKEDDDETAIKLLLCVNQLNEGVHIKGVDAVIMVRRTSSPTIFYQQLGRALTAAGNFEPLVIDLVDNFEMIGIEQIVSMMSESYARLSGENDPEELIPPSAFKVIDHEKDARNLAKNLERRLALRSEKLTIDEKIALWKGL